VTTPLTTGSNGCAQRVGALQWIAVAGLRRYGQRSLSATIACRWNANVERVYQQSGKLVEKYDVVTTGRSGGAGVPDAGWLRLDQRRHTQAHGAVSGTLRGVLTPELTITPDAHSERRVR